MKVAITGARGFVGRAVAAEAERRGDAVLPLDDVRALAADPAELGARLAGVDALVHLAGPAHAKAGAAEKDRYFRDIRDLSVTIWHAARKAGCARFVYASSIKVYGEGASDAALTEDSPCRPESVYGEAKLAAEAALRELAAADPAMRLVILRFPPMYGPGMRGAVRHLFGAARLRLPLPLHGLGNRRTMLYVGNAARVALAAAAGGLTAPVYLPHDPGAWTMGALYAAIYEAVHGRPLPWWLRWRMPRALLAAVPGLRPLVAPFELASRHEGELAGLGLVEPRAALRRAAALE